MSSTCMPFMAAPCPRCGADFKITNTSIASITCSPCNLTAICLRPSSPSGLIIADDLARLRIKCGEAPVKYRGGTLKVACSVGQISIDRHKNVNVKGGGSISFERFNDVLVDHATRDVCVKRCNDVRFDDAAGKVCVKRCDNVRVESGAGEVDVGSVGSFSEKRSMNVGLDGGRVVSVKRCGNVDVVTEGSGGDVEINWCRGVSLNANGEMTGEEHDREVHVCV